MPENSDDAKKVVQLGDYRARRTSRVDASDEIDEYEEDDSERFIVNFTGSPDEIFVQFVDWLSGDPDIGAIITVRPQLLTLEDEPNEDWHGRHPDATWEETIPGWGLEDDDGDRIVPFDASKLLALVRSHPDDFKALFEQDRVKNPDGNAFLAAFYQR